jgi:hypothetical protein
MIIVTTDLQRYTYTTQLNALLVFKQNNVHKTIPLCTFNVGGIPDDSLLVYMDRQEIFGKNVRSVRGKMFREVLISKEQDTWVSEWRDMSVNIQIRKGGLPYLKELHLTDDSVLSDLDV